MYCRISFTLSCSGYYPQFISSFRKVSRCMSIASSLETNPLPLSAMPGPRGTLGNVFEYAKNGGVAKMCDIQRERFERYGPIFCEKMFGRKLVNISDVDAIADVLRAEPVFPFRPGFDAHEKCLEELDRVSGLSSNGELWYKVRSFLSPKMMRPKEVSEALPGFHSVAKDFVQRVHFLRQADGTVKNLENELFYWAAETMCTVLFDKRLGFYNHPPDPQAVDFIKATLRMTNGLGKLVFGLPLYKYFDTPSYSEYKKAVTDIRTIGEDIVAGVKAEKRQYGPNNSCDKGKSQSLFDYVSFSGEFSLKSTVDILVDLMAAGVDTTTVVVLWTIYLLSRHPHIQEKLHKELQSVLGSEKEITARTFGRLPLLKSCIKESMRLRPPAIVIARQLDKDIEVLGYNIPAGVEMMLYTHVAAVSERHYGEDANEFVPERWLRDESSKKKEYNPFTTLPFGYGVRMCLGRRIAEAEICAILSQLVLGFRLEYAGLGELNQHFSVIVKPDKPVLVKFIPR